MHAAHEVVSLEVLADTLVGQGGFLAIRRMTLRNVRADGSRSAPYLCDFVVRPKGIDAVVVAIFTRTLGKVQVLVREGLRPPLHLGRPADELPLPEERDRLYVRELVAGIVEKDDRGEEGVKRRAAIEVDEETGLSVRAEDVSFLGAGVFPSGGSMPEKHLFCAVEVQGGAEEKPPEGDGSPMEEGARLSWVDLDQAILACETGEIEDAKTEIALRRLRDRLR